MKAFPWQVTWVLPLESYSVCITQTKKPKTISSLEDDSDIDPDCVETVLSSESDTAHPDVSGDAESLSIVDKVFVHEQCKEPETYVAKSAF